MRSIALLLLLSASSLPPSSAVSFRCGIFSFLGNDRACRASCWVTGQKTGSCDDSGACNCSEEELDLSESVERLLGGLDLIDYLKLKFRSFKEEVDSWEISQKVKSLVPSRCRIGNGFCETSCHGIGRVTGKCNADFTDCECSSELVSAKQYGLCLDGGVCSLYCQRKGYARGDCAGEQNWDCTCITNKGNRELAELDPDEYDSVLDMADYEDEFAG